MFTLMTSAVYALSYDERNEKYRTQINGEIARYQELKVEKARAEVYAKELELQNEDINVAVADYNYNTTRNQFDNKFQHTIHFDEKVI
jgi:predicted RNA methylase